MVQIMENELEYPGVRKGCDGHLVKMQIKSKSWRSFKKFE